jgi:hypothetical protein
LCVDHAYVGHQQNNLGESIVQTIKFNINDSVRVKLTEAGRSQILKQHKDIYGDRWQQYPVRKIEEDSKGWSEWQLHDLMNTFGEMLYMGNNKFPFAATIEIILPHPPNQPENRSHPGADHQASEHNPAH